MKPICFHLDKICEALEEINGTRVDPEIKTEAQTLIPNEFTYEFVLVTKLVKYGWKWSLTLNLRKLKPECVNFFSKL